MAVPTLTASHLLRARPMAEARPAQAEPPYYTVGIDGIIPYACGCGGSTPEQGAAPPAPSTPVFVAGTLRAEFSSLSVQKEFQQALDAADLDAPITQGLIARYLQRVEYQYVAREMIWILSIPQNLGSDSLPAYVVRPRGAPDLQKLINTLAALYNDSVGVLTMLRGTQADRVPDDGRVGAGLPIADISELYPMSVEAFIDVINGELPPPPDDPTFTPENDERGLEYLNLMLGYVANRGDTDQLRAVNFTAFQYISLYSVLASMSDARYTEFFRRIQIPPDNYTLSGIRVAPSALQTKGKLIDVILSFQGQHGSAEISTTIDVTTDIPYVATSFGRYPVVLG